MADKPFLIAQVVQELVLGIWEIVADRRIESLTEGSIELILESRAPVGIYRLKGPFDAMFEIHDPSSASSVKFRA